jgi:hypothetical protein
MIDKEYGMVWELLLKFIKSKTGVDVNVDSLIFDDLGIDGLDAETFMKDFSDEFNIDLSDFNIDKYCFTEYEVGNFFLTLYRGIFQRNKIKKGSFKVTHLIEVIKTGKWIEPRQINGKETID